MEIAFVLVLAASIGLAVRYLVPGRETHGLAVLPAVTTSVGAAVWAALLWAGLAFDGGWIWILALAAATVAGLLSAFLLPRLRRAGDERYYEEARRLA